jgi:hypothetical protein
MKRIDRAVVAALALYVVAVAVGTLWWPLGRDQGIFAWTGDVILRGGVPYVDAWDVKGVAAHYTFALVQGLFGRTLWGIRSFDLILLFVSAFALMRLLRRYCDPFSAVAGAAFFALLHMQNGFWATSQPDGWAKMLIVCAMSLVWTLDPPSTRRLWLAGALIGLAALYKVLFVLFLVPLALPLVWPSAATEGSGSRRRTDPLLPLFVSCGGVIVVSLGWLQLTGALEDFWQIQFEFNRSVHAQTFRRSLAGTGKRFLDWYRWIFWTLPFVLIGLLTLWREHRRIAWALVLQCAVSVLFVVIQNKFYSYHWHPLQLSVVIWLAFGFSGLLGFVRGLKGRLGATWVEVVRVGLLVTILALAWFEGPPLNVTGWSAHVTGTLSMDEYYRPFKSYYNQSFRFRSNLSAVEHIAAHSTPDESVLVWGFEPMINYLSGRRSPTRFGYNYPVIASRGTPFEESYRSQFMHELAEDPPRYVVVAVGDQNSLMPRSSRDELLAFEPLSRLLRTRYELERTIRGFELWRRRARE